LKRAKVGISIVSAPEVESKQRKATEAMKKLKDKASGNRNSMNDPLRQLREAEAQLDEVELGDASVAAPFTSKSVSIKCCKDVIQQVRKYSQSDIS
jgi:manganese-transporting P-type ATPase